MNRHAQAPSDAADSRIPFWGGALCYRGDLKEAVLGHRFELASSYSIPERFWDEAAQAAPGSDIFQKMTYIELKQRLAELLLMRVDRMTMANSIEGRVPFLDHDLVEFAMALPPRMKVRSGVTKFILKESMRGIVPDEVINRGKQGFGTPMVEWLRGPFGSDARRQINVSSLRERGLLDYDTIDLLWREHLSGRADWSYELWNVYTASLWHDRWIAARPPGPGGERGLTKQMSSRNRVP